MHFIDEVKIYLKAGNGGAGAVSFRREKFIEYGGPDGGNGGKGGDIILTADSSLNTLIDFRYKQHFKAQIGMHGSGKNCSGESGKALEIKVPVGTQVFAEDGEKLIVDLDVVGQSCVIAKGGNGGAGNAVFKTSTNQAPKKAYPGKEGEEKWVWLRLKLLSDIGLVGLPNAGKSTFLSVTTRAKPKIADYPFTTLKPQLGVVNIDDSEFVIADIPGLIEGASQGHGLGDRFLRHIERCRILLHLIDINGNVVENYKIVQNELKRYIKDLTYKDEIVVLNKIDTLSTEEIREKVIQITSYTSKQPMICSGVSLDGVKEILRILAQKIEQQVA